MTTVTGTVIRPAGTAVVGAAVIIDLIASAADDQAPGYIGADEQEIWTRTIATTDASGTWTADLPPTAGTDNVYSQSGLVYAVTYSFGGGEFIHYIDVPASGSEVWLGSIHERLRDEPLERGRHGSEGPRHPRRPDRRFI